MFRFIFIIFPFLIFGLIAWALWREYNRVRNLLEFTEQERNALTRQAIALLTCLPFLLIYVLFFVSGQLFALNSLGSFYFSTFYLFIACAILGYVALSSIKHRVSILRGRGQRQPVKGRLAVFSGILTIIALAGFGLVFILSQFN